MHTGGIYAAKYCLYPLKEYTKTWSITLHVTNKTKWEPKLRE